MLPKEPFFRLEPDWKFRNRSFYTDHVWKRARDRNIPRVHWLDALTLSYKYHNQIVSHNGEPFDVPDVDDVFPDPENRWMSRYLQADASGTRPAHFSPKLLRLKLIYLFCEIDDFERNLPRTSRTAPGSRPNRRGRR